MMAKDNNDCLTHKLQSNVITVENILGNRSTSNRFTPVLVYIIKLSEIVSKKEELSTILRQNSFAQKNCMNSGIPTPENLASSVFKLALAQQWNCHCLKRQLHGKPFMPKQRAEWNIAHDEELVCLGLSSSTVGVDIERVTPENDNHFLAGKNVFPKELLNWITQDEDEKTLRFFQAWTCVEAALKAEGVGFGGEKSRRFSLLKAWHFDSLMLGKHLLTCAGSERPIVTVSSICINSLLPYLRSVY